MVRKPNYNFERKERDRLKAEKKAKRVAEKEEARNKKSDQSESTDSPDDTLPGGSGTERESP